MRRKDGAKNNRKGKKEKRERKKKIVGEREVKIGKKKK